MKKIQYEGVPDMTCESFCRATGWPYQEWLDLTISESQEILELYELTHTRVTLAMDAGYRAGYKDAMDAVREVLAEHVKAEGQQG